MGRYPQPANGKGSLKWTQQLINDYPDLLNKQIKTAFSLKGTEEIEWVSPLKDDQYAEYRDDDFIKLLDSKLDRIPLKDFWPDRKKAWGQVSTFDKFP